MQRCGECQPDRVPARIGRLIGQLLTLALLLGLASTPAHAADHLQRLLDRFIAEEELDGGVLLVSGPDLRRVVVSGIADRRGERPVTEETRFYVASVGKMATAAVVMQQVEEGLLSLDRPVRELAPDLPLGKVANANRARLVHLLDHSSGIPDYTVERSG